MENAYFHVISPELVRNRDPEPGCDVRESQVGGKYKTPKK
ncbi:hypothetical protein RB2501_13159 [Robiginitalea biformata HTCC2501]|uniref:Uncharacterized protein n=1 Tax=Robiginitalea biformata (strain ATCC BAA-864 / DSM 15991 / KCTC 12146 / HTCC2501) TaxID=313596 RepID=A4CK79_ROBBH|nr:hypothetical protein RB2501_13159 [Robiginitalea biformata HTCC2501]